MLLDRFPPSPFARNVLRVGGVSIDDTVHIHRQPIDLPTDGSPTGVFEARDAADGLALETGRLADPSGRLVAESFHTRLLLTAKLPDMVTGAG